VPEPCRRRRRSQSGPVGAWLPEPLISTDERMSSEQESLLADSVGMALLVVLDTLAPSERLAFVLQDMFAVSFDEIAPILDKTPAATRQLASRARRRIRVADTTPNPDLGPQRKVVAAFLAAARAGDFAALIEVLHPAVVVRLDAGARRVQTPAVFTGAPKVATQSASAGPWFAKLCHPALVNGAAGLVVRDPTGCIVAAAGMTVIGGLIREIDLVLDPYKLIRAQSGRTAARRDAPCRPYRSSRRFTVPVAVWNSNRAVVARTARSSNVWIVTTTRAVSVRGTMSP
jgi:hypothetical protein